MAGTLTISTLSDGTNSTSATNCIQGSSKAWVSYDNAVGAIRGSYNVSSVTKNGTGIFTINFTNALADTNYSWVGNVVTSTGSFGMSLMGYGTTVYSTTQVQICQKAGNGNSTFDGNYHNVAVFR